MLVSRALRRISTVVVRSSVARGATLANPRNERSLAAWIPVTPDDPVGIVGAYPALRRSLEAAGAQVIALPAAPPDGHDGPRLAHLLVPLAQVDDPWLAPGMAAEWVRAGGTVLVGARHRWSVLRRQAWSAAELTHGLTLAGLTDCRLMGLSNGLYSFRALVPLDAATMRWYAQHAFMPRSYREVLGVRVLCALGIPTSLRAMFPMLVGVGTVRPPA